MKHSDIMFLNVNMQSIVRFSFYLILIGVCITSWIKLLKEPTTFEEKVLYNKTRLPSFTLCPEQPYNDPITNKSIESFEDIEKAIENIKDKYTIEYAEQKNEHPKINLITPEGLRRSVLEGSVNMIPDFFIIAQFTLRTLNFLGNSYNSKISV